MIDALRSDEIVYKVGGHFKLTALMQKRWLQLMQGARPMVEPEGKTDLEIIAQEIIEGKITAEFAPPAPQAAPEDTPGVTSEGD